MFPAGGYSSDTTWKLENSEAMNIVVKTPTPVVMMQQQQQQVAPAPPLQAYSHYGYAIPAQYPFMVLRAKGDERATHSVLGHIPACAWGWSASCHSKWCVLAPR